MFRVLSLVVVFAFTYSAFCDVAFADPDNSIVSVSLGGESSSLMVSGGTRLDVVAAVAHGLYICERPADDITVGPSQRFPEIAAKDVDGQPRLTVCISGKSTAFIAITPKLPFSIVTAIATELRGCGFTDVRLLSDDEAKIAMGLADIELPQASANAAQKLASPK